MFVCLLVPDFHDADSELAPEWSDSLYAPQRSRNTLMELKRQIERDEQAAAAVAKQTLQREQLQLQLAQEATDLLCHMYVPYSAYSKRALCWNLTNDDRKITVPASAAETTPEHRTAAEKCTALGDCSLPSKQAVMQQRHVPVPCVTVNATGTQPSPSRHSHQSNGSDCQSSDVKTLPSTLQPERSLAQFEGCTSSKLQVAVLQYSRAAAAQFAFAAKGALMFAATTLPLLLSNGGEYKVGAIPSSGIDLSHRRCRLTCFTHVFDDVMLSRSRGAEPLPREVSSAQLKAPAAVAAT